MVDFIDSNGEFDKSVLIIIANTRIGPDASVKVFKVFNKLIPGFHTWELVGHLPKLENIYKIIDRRDATF